MLDWRLVCFISARSWYYHHFRSRQSLANHNSIPTHCTVINRIFTWSRDRFCQFVIVHTSLRTAKDLVCHSSFRESLWRLVQTCISVYSRRFVHLWWVWPLRVAHSVRRSLAFDLCEPVIILPWSRYQFVLLILLYVVELVRNGFLRASLANLAFLIAVCGRTWAELLFGTGKRSSLLLPDWKHRRSLLEVDCLAIASWAWLHFLLSCATKSRALTCANPELRARLMLTILTILDVVVSWAWNILLYYLIDCVCPRVHENAWSFWDGCTNWVASNSRIRWIFI